MIYPNKPLYLLSLLGYIYYLTYYTLTTKDNINYVLSGKQCYTITNKRRRKSMEKVKCPKCGFEVKQGTELCPKCGEPVKDYYVYQKIREKVEKRKEGGTN